MNMKQIFFVAFFALCATYVSAQDVIVKKDGSTILSKVLEVNTSDVKYKKFSNKKGPTYTINKSEIMSINYENGEKDLFNGTILETDTKGSKQSLIPSVANQRNSELLSLYNKHYSPSNMITIVIGELCLAAITQFPTFRQRVGLIGRKEPFAYFLVAVDGEVTADVVQLAVKVLCAGFLIVGIGDTELQTERSRV